MASSTQWPRNEAAVQAYLNNAVRQAVDYMFSQVKKFNADYIDKVVYDAFESDWYQRTYVFRNAWDYSDAVLQGGNPQIQGNDTVVGKFAYDTTVGGYNPQHYEHGSPQSGNKNQYLPLFIYEGVVDSMFGTMPARNAWARLEQKVTKKQMVDWIATGLRKQGIKVEVNI